MCLTLKLLMCSTWIQTGNPLKANLTGSFSSNTPVELKNISTSHLNVPQTIDSEP